MAKRLETSEVKKRIESYNSPETTNELYSFGYMLVAEAVDRIHKMESKAGTLAGYSGAILALIISTFSLWHGYFQTPERVAMYCAALTVFLAEGCALWALKVSEYNWFSDNEWLRAERLSDAEALRKYHILTMHTAFASHRAVAEEKSKLIFWSQKVLFLTGLSFMAVVGLRLIQHFHFPWC